MSNSSLTAAYDNLPKIAKILLQLFLGAFVGGIYRIVKFLETKNVITLVVGVIALVTGVGNLVAWIVDLFTQITEGKIKYFAD